MSVVYSLFDPCARHAGRLRDRMVGAAAIVLVLGLVPAAGSQGDNPVYVDQSPRAWELLRRARDQVSENVGESVRLYQELLDAYGMKLVPRVAAEGEGFVAVRSVVLNDLVSHPALLEKYRRRATPRAKEMLEADELDSLASRLPLTEAGLEALLRLGQRALESGHFRAAEHWLGGALEHPDLPGRRAAHAWYMLGLTGRFLGDEPRIERAREALGGLGERGRRLLAQLEEQVDEPVFDPVNRSVGPLDQGLEAALGEPVAQPIWSVELKETLAGRRSEAPGAPEVPRLPDWFGGSPFGQVGETLTVVPAVAGPLVYLNQGHTVLALDPATGREVWRYADRPIMTVIDRDTELIMDLNHVAVEGRTLITLTGHAYAAARSTEGHVVCLDALTGEKRWATTLDHIGGVDEHEGLFPHGPPIIGEGVVYVLARKVTPQHLSSCYVVALDAESGRLRWSQQVVSVGGLRAHTYRRFSMPAYVDGDLYVATPLGAVARLDGVTGRVRWLRRYAVPLDERPPSEAPGPWTSGGPIVGEDRVIALQPDRRRIVALDRETGDTLSSHTCLAPDGWSAPRYLLADEGMIFGIGEQVRAFRQDDLVRPAWRLPSAPEAAEAPESAAPADVEIVGRVQLTRDELIVPAARGILLVDKTTGAVRHRLESEAVGNVLAVDAQLFVAGGERLSTYMSFDRAVHMLGQRMAEAPHDAGPALSLLELGIARRDLPLAIDAARLAAQRIEAMDGTRPVDEARAALFDLLLELHESQLAERGHEAEALYRLMGEVADSPVRHVGRLLAQGDWCARHDPQRAAAPYQQILSDPTLAETWRREGEVRRPAAVWAARRIAELIDVHGRPVYESQERAARRLLVEFDEAGPAGAAPLATLAEAFPFTEAGVEAALRAAETHLLQQDHRAALGLLGRMIRIAPQRNREAMKRLVGAYAAACEELGLAAELWGALRYAADVCGNPVVATSTGAGPAAERLERLETMEAGPRRPRVGATPALAEPIAGEVVPMPGRADGDPPPDRALLVKSATVRLIGAPDLAERWSSFIDSEAPQVLRFNGQDILLWLGDIAGDPRAVMLNAADGTERWMTPRLSEYMSDPAGDLARLRGVTEQMPGGEPFNPSEIIPCLDDDLLVLVQRTGGAIAFDTTIGGVPLWSQTQLLEQVFDVRLRDGTLVLAGRKRALDPRTERGESPSMIVVMDARRGRMVHQLRPLGGGEILWVRFGPVGTLVCATTAGLELLDINRGRTSWTSGQAVAVDCPRGWPLGAGMLIEGRLGLLRRLDLVGAAISEPLPLPVGGQWDPLEPLSVAMDDGGAWAHYRQRVLRYDRWGGLIGADAVVDDRDYLWLLRGEGCVVLVSRYRTEQAVIADESGRRTLRTYRLYVLAEDGRLAGPALELVPMRDRLVGATLVDGWVLLSTTAEVLAVPLRTEGGGRGRGG